MAYIQNTIVDLDDLLTSWTDNTDGTYDSTEIAIDAVNKTFTLNQAGNLATVGSGVTGQALYSLFKDRWQTVESITKFDFPMLSITNEQFEFINGWVPSNDTTRKMMRTAGWAEVDAAGTKNREYAGVVTLGSLADTDQVYFAQDSSYTATTADTDFTGPVNEAVQVYGDATNGDFDYRGYMNLYSRTRGKLYADSDLDAIGVTTMTYIVYRFPLGNANDLKIVTTADTELTSTGQDIPCDISPFDVIDVEYLANYIVGSGIDTTTGETDLRATAWATGVAYITGDVVLDTGRYFSTALGGTSSGTGVGDDVGVTDWTAYAGEFEIEDGTYSAYTVILDANNAGTVPTATSTKENIYEWAQYALRQTTAIDTATSRNGNVAQTLVYFIGDNLHTADGVYVADIAAADVNKITMHDGVDGTTHLFPTVVTVTINFNSNLSTDTGAKFYAYYTDETGGTFGDWDATQVKDAGGDDVGTSVSNVVTQDVSDPTSYAFSYAFSGDTTAGRAPDSVTNITVVALGLFTGQYVKASGDITAGGGTVSLVSPLERNYSDPV